MARILPLTPTVDLTTRRGTLRFESRLRRADRYLLAVDLYSHLRESHPETHLGYWVFPLPEGEALTTIGLDFTTIGPASVWKETAVGRQPAVDSWHNPHYVFDPVVGIQLVLRTREGRVVENRFVGAKVTDPAVLRSYYHRVHAGHGYTPAEPFLFELHAAMLRKLERIFRAEIPQGARVLDAGCGRSLFTEIRPDWSFMVVAADVEHALLCERQREFPSVRWVVARAAAPPRGRRLTGSPPHPTLAPLRRGGTRRWAVPLMRALLAAGALAPRYSLDMIFVARKKTPGHLGMNVGGSSF